MNEELQNAVSEFIQKTVDGADKSVAFLEGQIPDYIEQLLLWHGWYNFLMCVSGIVLVTGWTFVYYKGIRFSWPRREEWFGKYDPESPFFMLWGLGGGTLSLIVLGFGITMINVTWLQIWIAPKVFLVEYAMDLVK